MAKIEAVFLFGKVDLDCQKFSEKWAFEKSFLILT